MQKGSIALISARCPEDYHPNVTNNGYVSEYILIGHINSNATDMNLEETYTKYMERK